MEKPTAPDKYTPEHCNWVQTNMLSALESAVSSLKIVASGNKDLTEQTIFFLKSALNEIKFEQMSLRKEIVTLKLKFYGSGVLALIFLIGLIMQFFSITKGIPKS